MYLSQAKIGAYVKFKSLKEKACVTKGYSGYFTAQLYNPQDADLWRVFNKVGKGTELVCANSALSLALYGKMGVDNVREALLYACHYFSYTHVTEPLLFARTIGVTYPADAAFMFNREKEAGCFDSELLAEDLAQLRNNDLMVEREWLWLPATGCREYNDRKEYAVKTLHASGYVTNVKSLYSEEADGQVSEDFHTCGVLPILAMPWHTKIVKGEGSKESPFEFDWE